MDEKSRHAPLPFPRLPRFRLVNFCFEQDRWAVVNTMREMALDMSIKYQDTSDGTWP